MDWLTHEIPAPVRQQ